VTIADVKKDDAGLAEQVASLGPQLEKSSISILSPDPLPAMTIDAAEDAPDDSAQVAAETGDPAVRALMFGRYTGQISARIERAWRRPRSPVNELAQAEPPRVGIQEIASDIDEMFSCLVQIRQDARGNVEEVLLLKCNGTEDWRHSLVIAINQSSPLPAPPIPTVFTQSLTMTFEAHAYRPGKNPDDYEMEPMSVPPAIVATRPAEGRLNGEVHDR
jgi:hypothetical protein